MLLNAVAPLLVHFLHSIYPLNFQTKVSSEKIPGLSLLNRKGQRDLATPQARPAVGIGFRQGAGLVGAVTGARAASEPVEGGKATPASVGGSVIYTTSLTSIISLELHTPSVGHEA